MVFFFIFWQRSKVLSIKLWPKLKFWHWSPWCRVPVSISTAQFLVTCQIYGSFEGATLYLFCKNPRLGDNNCDQNWNFGTGLVAFKRLLWIILNYPWWHVNQIGWTNIQSNKIIFNLFNEPQHPHLLVLGSWVGDMLVGSINLLKK